MSIADLIIPVLLAVWVYAGRAILLCLFYPSAGPLRSVANRFALGLLVTPVLVAAGTVFFNSITAVLLLVTVVDAVLVIAVIASIRSAGRPAWTTTRFACVAPCFAILCMVLTLFNGPFVEQLSDAWWHMRHVADVLYRAQWGMAFPAAELAGSMGKLMDVLGLDESSYRLQAMTAKPAGLGVLQAWYGSTVAVCGLLGASFYLLAMGVLPSRTGRMVALVTWLLILGGMNSGFRLGGWPAGMGYVFLNLGLLASFGLWSGGERWRDSLVLLGISIAGMGFFHFAELYILATGLALLVLVRLVCLADNFFKLCGVMVLVTAATGLIWWLGSQAGTPPPVSAVAAVIMMFACLMGTVLLARLPGSVVRIPGIILLVGIAGYIGINWPHFIALFSNTAESGKDFYSAYIPRFLPGFLDNWLRIPKWEHQLRASILWSGVVAVLAGPALYWYFRDRTSLWLATLGAGTAIILLSPPLFTVAITLIPPYGGYRIQYLIPTALTIGFAVSRGIQLFTASPDPASPGSGTSWTRRTSGIALILVCAIAIYPDMATRFGLISDRPWAVHDNVNYHWRWTDKRRTIFSHTSWRYKPDFAEIRKVTANKSERFISDLATSYYVAAETRLKPMVQQDHHSGKGRKYRRLFAGFCTGDIDSEELFSRLRKAAAGYVVVNRDTRNYTAEVSGTSCVGETDHMVDGLQRIADPVYQGEYLSLWKLQE